MRSPAALLRKRSMLPDLLPASSPPSAFSPSSADLFTQQEEDAHQPLAVISYALWMNRYNRDPHVLGQSIVLDRKAYSIIGVMPRSFEFPLQAGHLNQAQLWVPMSLTPEELSDQAAGIWGYHIVARLKDGVSLAQAAQDANRVAGQIMRNFPAGMSAIHIRGDVALVARACCCRCPAACCATCFWPSAIVLLIACVNVAGLAAGPGNSPASRICRSTGSGCAARHDHQRISLRRSVAEPGRRFAGPRVCRHRHPHHVVPAARVHAARRLNLHGRNGRRLRSPARAGNRRSLQPCARLRSLADQPDGEPQRGRPDRFGCLQPRLAALSPGSLGDRHRTRAAHHLRRLPTQLPEDARRRPRLPSRSRPRRWLSTASQPVPHRDFRRDLQSCSVIDRSSKQARNRRRRHRQHPPASWLFQDKPLTQSRASPPKVGSCKFAEFAIIYGDYFRAMGIPLLDGRYFTMEDRSDCSTRRDREPVHGQTLLAGSARRWQANSRRQPKKGISVGDSGWRRGRY